MTQKLKKITTEKIINFPFQKVKFFQWLFFSIISGSVFFYLANLAIPFISGTSLLCLIIIYLIPTLVAFDLFSSYNDDQNIPQLKNPKRMLVLLINILFGFTILGWIISLYIAFNPGVTRVTIIKYKS